MANQMLVKGDDEKPTLTIEQTINGLLFNQDLSDVCFLLGDQREKIYVHRLLLAAGSDVFRSMFYGELKETRYEIEVPDLSPVGFRNMNKYFYTKKVDIDLSEIHSTYLAANKYLASGLIKDLTGYITKSLSVSNLCVIYEQLLKLAIDDSLICDVKSKIAAWFSKVCASDSFKQIGEDTLVSILKFNMLHIPEFELLKACLRWTDGEVARRDSGADQTSKRAAFEPIKHLIRLGDIKLNDFSSIYRIESYLTVEEIGSVFLHLSYSTKPIQIEYRSPRKPYKTPVIRAIKYKDETGWFSSYREVKISIRVDKAVDIGIIKTFAVTNSRYLRFKLYRDGQLLTDTQTVQNPLFMWYWFRFENLTMEPNANYEMQFYFSIFCLSYTDSGSYPSSLGISREMTLKSDGSSAVFKIESALGYHCIESISFSDHIE